MTAGNRQRKGVGYSGTTPESYCNLEEGDSDFPLFAMIPWKVTVLIFKLLEQIAFINVGNDSDGSGDCRKGDKLIIFNSTLLGQLFTGTMLCDWPVKPKILSNFVLFVVSQK